MAYIRQADLISIDPSNEHYHVPLNRIYIGVKATEIIQSITNDTGMNHPDVELFYSHCKEFLIECIKQIQSRFDTVKFDFLSCLFPEVAFNLAVPSLSGVYAQLPYLKDVSVLQDADTEWRQHPLNSKLNGQLTSQEYRKVVFNAKNSLTGAPRYPNLSKIVAVLFSLPFSNASVEQVFSQLKLIKSDHRAALKQQSLIGLMMTKLTFQDKGTGQAVKLDPPKKMIKLQNVMKSSADDEDTAKLRKALLQELRD